MPTIRRELHHGEHHLYHPLSTLELHLTPLLERTLHHLSDTAANRAVRTIRKMIRWEEEATVGQTAVLVGSL